MRNPFRALASAESGPTPLPLPELLPEAMAEEIAPAAPAAPLGAFANVRGTIISDLEQQLSQEFAEAVYTCDGEGVARILALRQVLPYLRAGLLLREVAEIDRNLYARRLAALQELSTAAAAKPWTYSADAPRNPATDLANLLQELRIIESRRPRYVELARSGVEAALSQRFALFEAHCQQVQTYQSELGECWGRLVRLLPNLELSLPADTP